MWAFPPTSGRHAPASPLPLLSEGLCSPNPGSPPIAGHGQLRANGEEKGEESTIAGEGKEPKPEERMFWKGQISGIWKKQMRYPQDSIHCVHHLSLIFTGRDSLGGP